MSLSKSRTRSGISASSAQSSASRHDNFPENPSDADSLQEDRQTNDQLQENAENIRRGEKSIDSLAESTFIPWRIFVNHIDSYHGKKLAELLPGRDFETKVEDPEEDNDPDDDSEEWKGQEPNLPHDEGETKKRSLEVVGTVKDEEYKRPEDITMVIRTTRNKELLLRELMKCGVVVYDITQDDSQIEEANWALEAIAEELSSSQRDGPKASKRFSGIRYFILISTVMTWALTKPLNPENPDLPFTEADFKKRKPHPNFKEHIKCERNVATVVKRHGIKDKLKTVVLGAGITYGEEEGPLHHFFKMAWHNAEYLPIFGRGSNKIPLLYVRDLVEVVHLLIKKWPKSRYIVAVEQELISQATIVKKISKALTTGKVKFIAPEEAFLFSELSQRSYDISNVNINIAPGYIINNDLNWHWDMPFRDIVDNIVGEYKKTRNLYPVKMIVLGPPASGKTVLAQKLADHYKIHYVHVKSFIEDTIQKLSKEIEDTSSELEVKDTVQMAFEDSEEEDEEEENTSRMDNLRKELNEIRGNLAKNNGRLDDDILNKLFMKRLSSKDCQNQGYVLDGYPKTLSQAKSLFESDDYDEEDEETQSYYSDVPTIGTYRKIMPELVIVLEADDEFLIERVIRLPEKDIQRTHYNEEGMLRRLKEYRERNSDEETPLQFFDEHEIHPLFINIEEDICPEMFSIFVQCIKRLGEPRNYGPSDLEREEAKKRREAEALAISKTEAARKEHEDLERKRARQNKMMEWTELKDKLKKEEEEQFCTMVEPLRYYLVKYIFPTLTKGLIEVAKLRPEDPVDFLAEFLFRENPEGKMFEPDYTETMSMLLDAIDKLQAKILPLNELNSGDEKYLKTMEEKQRGRVDRSCRISSNDETAILTEDDEEDDQDGMRRKASNDSIALGTSSGMEVLNPHSGIEMYVRDSEIMVASSFSYELIAEDSRNSFGNSTNLSLQDSR